MWAGMSSSTGRTVVGTDHIRQSIRDILITPVGSRVMRRPYGSLLPSLIDQPANPANRLRLISATYMAIIRWEPRVRINHASVEIGIDGRAAIELTAQHTEGPRSGAEINLLVPIQ